MLGFILAHFRFLHLQNFWKITLDHGDPSEKILVFELLTLGTYNIENLGVDKNDQ